MFAMSSYKQSSVYHSYMKLYEKYSSDYFIDSTKLINIIEQNNDTQIEHLERIITNTFYFIIRSKRSKDYDDKLNHNLKLIIKNNDTQFAEYLILRLSLTMTVIDIMNMVIPDSHVEEEKKDDLPTNLVKIRSRSKSKQQKTFSFTLSEQLNDMLMSHNEIAHDVMPSYNCKSDIHKLIINYIKQNSLQSKEQSYYHHVNFPLLSDSPISFIELFKQLYELNHIIQTPIN